MWLRRVSLSSLLLLALGSAIALAKPTFLFPQGVAQIVGGQKGEAHGEFKSMEQLNLTPDQRQKLKTIYARYKGQISQRRRVLRQETRELRDLMVGTAPIEEVRAQYQEVQAQRQQLEAVSFESMLTMREVLTPVQRSQFAQLMEQQAKTSPNQMGR